MLRSLSRRLATTVLAAIPFLTTRAAGTSWVDLTSSETLFLPPGAWQVMTDLTTRQCSATSYMTTTPGASVTFQYPGNMFVIQGLISNATRVGVAVPAQSITDTFDITQAPSEDCGIILDYTVSHTDASTVHSTTFTVLDSDTSLLAIIDGISYDDMTSSASVGESSVPASSTASPEGLYSSTSSASTGFAVSTDASRLAHSANIESARRTGTAKSAGTASAGKAGTTSGARAATTTNAGPATITSTKSGAGSGGGSGGGSSAGSDDGSGGGSGGTTCDNGQSANTATCTSTTTSTSASTTSSGSAGSTTGSAAASTTAPIPHASSAARPTIPRQRPANFALAICLIVGALGTSFEF